MRYGKSHKMELGTHRPTEKAVDKAIINQKVSEWLLKIDKASTAAGVRSAIEAVADVLVVLIKKAKTDEVEAEALKVVLEKRKIIASLTRAWEKLQAEKRGA